MPNLSRQEIESHSSQLTNLRIANLVKIICVAEMEANNAIPPTVQHAIAYHSALLTFFFETAEIYDTDANKEVTKKIEQCVKNGEIAASYMKTVPPEKLQHKIVLLSISNSKKWRFLMHRGMQNLKYWFRLGKHDPKGIDEILKLFGNDEIPERSGELPHKLEEQPTADAKLS